jgi:hypothetical protein
LILFASFFSNWLNNVVWFALNAPERANITFLVDASPLLESPGSRAKRRISGIGKTPERRFCGK